MQDVSALQSIWDFLLEHLGAEGIASPAFLLTAVVAPGHRADYPLRLTGFYLEYLQKGVQSGQASLTIGPVRGTAGPGTSAIAAAPAGRSLLAVGDGSAAGPTLIDAQAGGPGLVVTFQTGKAQTGFGGGPA